MVFLNVCKISKPYSNFKNKYYGPMSFFWLFVPGVSNVPQILPTEDFFPKIICSAAGARQEVVQLESVLPDISDGSTEKQISKNLF